MKLANIETAELEILQHLLPLLRRASVDTDFEVAPGLKLTLPIVDDAARCDNQSRRPLRVRWWKLATHPPARAVLKFRNILPPPVKVLGCATFTHDCGEETDDLDRLAEAHVVAQ